MGKIMSMKKTNNKGFSLVELMVVIAIIAVLGGVFINGFYLISSKQVDQCAKKMQMALENARSTSMGKSNVDLKFYYSGGKIYVDKKLNNDSTKITKTEVGDDGLTIKYTYAPIVGTATEKNLSTNPLSGVEFDRASGALKPLSGTNNYLTKITVTNGRKTVTVNIERLTGRVTID